MKYVTKNTGQLETMLKVILAPDVGHRSNVLLVAKAASGPTRRLRAELLPLDRGPFIQQFPEGAPN